MELAGAPEKGGYQPTSALPWGLGILAYAILVFAGNTLLRDPDTFWQIAMGRWIREHGRLPDVDVFSFTMNGQPWISTQWLSQILFSSTYDLAGWAGPILLTALAAALAVFLLARFLSAHVTPFAVVFFTAAAFILTFPHLVARPHMLALPIMVAWAIALIGAADERRAPHWWSLALMLLWANVHGGFIFGLALIVPIAIDAIWNADASARRALAMRWTIFAIAALACACVTPYGFESLLASRRILNLGEALNLIGEWRPQQFDQIGAFEIVLLLGIALALWRGITLPPLRIVLLLGLLHMALAHLRNAEVFGFLAPIVIAQPLGPQIAQSAFDFMRRGRAVAMTALAALLVGATVNSVINPYVPDPDITPAGAVAALKQHRATRIFNDYDFGGYMIASGLRPFIDGRTELYGETFMVSQFNAAKRTEPGALTALLEKYRIDATLLRTQSTSAKFIDTLPGWTRVYSDKISVVHVRRDLLPEGVAAKDNPPMSGLQLDQPVAR